MRSLVAVLPFLALAACGEQTRALEYLCTNGPDISIVYSGDTAVLTYPDGRRETLTRPEPARSYAYSNATTLWSESNRGGRLTTPERSLRCEQMGGR